MGARSGAAVQISRVSSKGQVTLPKMIREAIGVGPGDAVAYDIGKGAVTLRRLEPIDLAFHAVVESTLAEWSSKETTRRTVTCEAWQVVVVPFPFTDRATTKRRPALVLSAKVFNRHGYSVL